MRVPGANFWSALALGLLLSACAKAPIASVSEAERDIIAANMMRDIATLASDEFGGRRPGTDGERLALDYITGRYAKIGLVSGTNDPGSAWRAPVPLVSTVPETGSISISRTARAKPVELSAEQTAVFSAARQERVADGELVFVGYGKSMPERDAINGRVAVLLGEPGKSPARRSELFKSDPAAVLTVVKTVEQIEVVQQVFGRERLALNTGEAATLSAFVTEGELSRVLGEDQWQQLLEAASDSQFEATPLGARISLTSRSKRREFTSYNAIAKLPGSVENSGAVLLLAHWDHLGDCGGQSEPDQVCNGAVDNASGIALMLELASRLSAAGPFDRDIYFLATSAEEAGLLGAKAFVDNPPIPLESVVAAFNFDTVAIAPAGTPLGFVGQGRTALDPLVENVVKMAGREIGDPDFAESFVQRQDGWALLENGVPALFLSSAFASQDVLGPYLEGKYHRPTDDISAIELGGAIDDLLLHEELVKRVADTSSWPGRAGE